LKSRCQASLSLRELPFERSIAGHDIRNILQRMDQRAVVDGHSLIKLSARTQELSL
jgi:hypothetical protein